MAKSYRIERLNESIKEILSEVVLSQLKDPRVGLVTITAVKVSGDLSIAKVHYSVMGDEEQRKDTEKGLKSARLFMRKVIGNELQLRSAPDLRFVYDDSLDRSLAIERALREAREGDAAAAAQNAAAGEEAAPEGVSGPEPGGDDVESKED